MSFSSDVKKEICSVEQFDREALKAELYGMLLFSRNFSPNKITFTTESNYAGNRLIFLLQNLYMPIIEKQSALRTKSSDSHLYKIIVVDGNDCKRIFEDFGHTDGECRSHIPHRLIGGGNSGGTGFQSRHHILLVRDQPAGQHRHLGLGADAAQDLGHSAGQQIQTVRQVCGDLVQTFQRDGNRRSTRRMAARAAPWRGGIKDYRVEMMPSLRWYCG